MPAEPVSQPGRIARNRQQTSVARRKRDRYTTHACNRCKAAKVRCDGRLPCAYCAARDPTTCHYSAQRLPSFLAEERQQDRFQASVLTLLEQQSEKLDLLTGQTAMLAAAHKLPVLPLFNGGTFESDTKQALPLFLSPTSSLFCVNVIDARVRKLEHPASEVPTLRIATAPSPTPSSDPSDVSESSPQMHPPPQSPYSSSTRPLEELDRNHIMQIVESYGYLEGVMYPIVDTAEIMQTAKCFLDARARDSNRTGVGFHLSELGRNDLAILKLVVAIGLLTEGDMHNTMTLRLFQSVQPDVESLVWGAAVDLKDLVLMTLVSLYSLHRGTWRWGWRFLGNVTRTILELGLNREIVLARSFPNPSTRIRAINTIWTVYVLERQLSYGLGVTNAVQDLRLEATFPQPVGAPFLKAMIEYARIGKQATDDLLGDRDPGHQQLNNWQDNYAFFQYQLERWTQYTSSGFAPTSISNKVGTGLQFVRTILSLRANHLRILVARAFLCTGLRTAAPLDIWTTSVDVAADTVQTLANLDHFTKEYRFHQAQFNHFLVSALDILLFATTCESSKHGNPLANGKEIIVTDAIGLKARQSSMVALNLLRNLAGTTHHSKYLWERMREVAARLNLSNYLFSSTSGTGSAASAKAGSEIHPQATTGGLINPTNPDDVGITMSQSKHSSIGQHDINGERPMLYIPTDDVAAWDFGGPLSLSEFELPPDTSSLLDTRWFP
ncbi:uncharacterized protein Z518_01317 [Rhinocladiella mackenziei CBS 650.93]|uniref:Rhinocladiella mackenziei CBS 650.93 unplaced genomic scaffold supercont1.1, whole genome shotgun sequence n=1 Tax=Rhinocladiella mackenziei CBS 650.93 TaxID=1442369 RepID=A0A0D2J3E6_9EURO|nr:uncharacterized protein Z518_01317 [Rhinocladiella mackenziei CBS 650.93]KIX10236.1 hypothetical protein Z518_01317 [Rhinocladiella mackenziei CBS 650.93]